MTSLEEADALTTLQGVAKCVIFGGFGVALEASVGKWKEGEV